MPGPGIRGIESKAAEVGRGESKARESVDRKMEIFVRPNLPKGEGIPSSFENGKASGLQDFLAIGERGGTPDIRLQENLKRYEAARDRALRPGENLSTPAEAPPPEITGLKSLIKNISYYAEKILKFLFGGLGAGMSGPMTIFPVWLLLNRAKPHNSITAQGPRLELMESELQGELNKNPKKGTTLEVWLEKSPPQSQWIADLKTVAQQRGIRIELKDIDKQSTIEIEAEKDGKTRALTTDPDLALAAPGEVTLVVESLDASPIGPKLSTLADLGFKNLQIKISKDHPAPQDLAESARIAVERGLELEIRSDKSENLFVRVIQDKAGAQIKINSLDIAKADATTRELVSKLLHSALAANCQSLQIGKGQVTIVKNPKAEGPAFHFSTIHPLALVEGVFSEYLAFETQHTLGTSPNLIPSYREFWQGAFRHAQEMEKNSIKDWKNPKDHAKQAEYAAYTSAPKWLQAWQNSLAAMQKFSKNPAHRQRLEKTFSDLKTFSQHGEKAFLGFEPFNGRALDDNAFELMRLFEAGARYPQFKLEIVLERISTVLGAHGNLEIYGAVVGTLFKAAIGKIGLDGKADSAAQNEFLRLLEMKADLLRMPGKYRISVIPEDRQQGANRFSPEFTRTPEWVVEEIGPDGGAKRALSVEVTQADGSKVSHAEIQQRIHEKLKQLGGHKFAKGAPVQQSLIVYKFYQASGSAFSLVEAVRQALEAETSLSNTKALPNLKVRVIIESHSGERFHTSSQILEIQNGKWVTEEYHQKKQAVGWY